MSFFDFLEKIQQKPEAARKKILAVSAVVIMAFIIFLWLNDSAYSFKKEEKDKTPGPFSVFKDAILDSAQNFKAEMK